MLENNFNNMNFWQKIKKPILCLAPMAGITDSAFRQLCKKYGADVVYTEMISADGLYYESKKTLAMLEFAKTEKPIVCQLFGKRPENFSKAAKIVEQAGFDGIDINFGCPARKVVAHGGGVTLMRDLEKCREIVAAVCQATRLPVSVKIRTRIGPIGRIGDLRQVRDKEITAVDFVTAIKGLAVAAMMVHGRSYEQGFSGPIDCEVIKKIKQQFAGIVLANGGINTPEDAAEILKKTGADGVGLARGVLGRPWLFKQVRQYLTMRKYEELNFEEIKKIALAHAILSKKSKGDYGLVELRKHLAWYVKGAPGASRLREKLVRVESVEEVGRLLKDGVLVR